MHGFINHKGKIIIEPVFDCIRQFVDDVTWVNKGGKKIPYDCEAGKWGLIDLQGQYILPPTLQLSTIQSYSEGLAWIKCGNHKYKDKWSIIDKNGDFIIKDRHTFDQAHPFYNNASIVEKKREKRNRQ